MNIPKPLYVALCLVIPPVWGLVSYWIFEMAARRWPRQPAEAKAADPAPAPAGAEPPEEGCESQG